MGKLPAFQFYPGDWLQDPISGCSLAAQGLFLRLCMLCDKRGELRNNQGIVISPEQIQRLCGHFSGDFTEPLEELIRIDVVRKKRNGLLHIPKFRNNRIRFVPPPVREPLSSALRTWVKEKFGYRCAFCGAMDWLEVDHIHPVSLGGTNDRKNLQLLCFTCNRKKGPRRGGKSHG